MEHNEMNQWLEASDKMMTGLRNGQIVEGTVSKIDNNEMIVHLNYMFDGVVPVEEFLPEERENLLSLYPIGSTITVAVQRVRNDEGIVYLSKAKADSVNNWVVLEDAFKTGNPITIKVAKEVPKGVVGNFKGYQVFVPLSQLELRYIEEGKAYVGKEISIRMIDLDAKAKRAVGSRKVLLAEEAEVKKKSTLKSITPGEVRTGKVTKLMKFGAFVDLGGVEGLIHLSNMAWHRVNKAEEILNVGDEVKVHVLEVDNATGKIGLSLKEVTENPWDTVTSRFVPGQNYEGTVVRVLDRGAIVELEKGIEGYLSMYEMTENNITKASDAVKTGDKVTVKVLEIQPENQRMSLSIKEVNAEPEEDYSTYNAGDDMGTLGDIFKDKFKDLF